MQQSLQNKHSYCVMYGDLENVALAERADVLSFLLYQGALIARMADIGLDVTTITPIHRT